MERLGAGGQETEEQVLARLLGKIEYLLSVDPANREFQAQREYFRKLMKTLHT